MDAPRHTAKSLGQENREVHVCVPAQGAMAVNMGRGGRDGQGDESTLS